VKVGALDLSRLSEDDAHSTQLDIVVFDRARYPVYEEFEEFAVMPPEGVIAIISVKKTLKRSQLRNELRSLRYAANLCTEKDRERGPHLGLFAFSAEPISTQEKWGAAIRGALEKEMQRCPFNHMVNEVTIFDQLVVFKFAPKSYPPTEARFVRCDLQDSHAKHLAIQRLLQSIMSVYYARLGEKMTRPGFVSFDKGTFGKAPELVTIKCQQ
jgi:hypothetical protein